MKDNVNLIWKNSMNFGAIMGLGLVFISFLQIFFSLEDSSLFQAINYIFIVSIIHQGTKKLRNQNNGFISYGNSLLSGTMISFFSSIIFAFYIYINFSFFELNGIENLLKTYEEQLVVQGNPDEQIEMIMEMYRNILTPTTLSFGILFAYTILGFIFSSIISIFVKKSDKNPFTNITPN